MSPTLVLLLATTLGAQPDDVAQGLVENGHKRVAVIPVVLASRASSGEQTTAASLGPRGKSLANALYDQLVASSQSGRKFAVVEERTMLRAMKARGFTPNDLKDPMKARQLGQDVGADSFVTLNYVPSIFEPGRPARDPDHLVFVSETRDAIDGSLTDKNTLRDDLTISKAAYQGESWELRRWHGSTLVNLGIDLPDAEPFGMGPAWEKKHYARLRRGLEHPCRIPDCPYAISVEVNGQTRVPEPLDRGDQTFLLVSLNQGEQYRIILENRSQKPVYCALYIDGASSIDRLVAEPDLLETRRHWYLPPNSGRRPIGGWYTIPRDASGRPLPQQFYDNFTVVSRDESMQQGASFEPNVGMITAIFYTQGMEGIPQPPPSMTPRALPASLSGTAAGGRMDASLGFAEAIDRGIMLAACTVHYRSADEVAQLLRGEGSLDDPLHPDYYQPASMHRDSSESPPGGGPTPPPMAGGAGGAEEYDLEP
jgi:hypothetical protein